MPGSTSGAPLGPATGGPRGPFNPGTRTAPVDGSVRDDPADWRTWWRFNSEAYIDLKTLLAQLDSATPSDADAKGSRRVTQKMVDEQVVPALWTALQTAGDTGMVRNAMLALARVEASWDVTEGFGYTYAAPKMLSSPHTQTAEAAIVALGVAGKASSVDALIEILADSAKGREIVGQPAIDYRRRSFAAYALALVGRKNEDPALRKRISFALMKNLDARATAPYDVQLASLIAFGLVPLPPHGNDLAAKNDPTHLCRGEQLNFLLDYLDDARRHPSLRAQAVIPLARLAQGAVDADFDAIRGALLEPLAARSKAPLEVKQSCVIGLGLLGDCDQDALDTEVRATLLRAASHEDRLTRSLAMISLAKVVGRPGKGTPDEKALVEAEEFLTGKLVRGDDSQRAWAALALGVLGCTQNDFGKSASPDLAVALRGALGTARSKDDLGAQCIGLGLLRDRDSGAALVERLDKAKDDGTRACAALATGLVGAKDGLERLKTMVDATSTANAVYVAAALALRIAGSSEVALSLAKRADRKPADDSTDDVARLLGMLGDARTVGDLAMLVKDSGSKPDVRAAACEALGEICDKRPRHWTSSLSTDLHYGLMSSTLSSFAGDGTGILEMR